MPEVSPNPLIDLNNAREEAYLEAALARAIQRRRAESPADLHEEIERMFDDLSYHGGCASYAE